MERRVMRQWHTILPPDRGIWVSFTIPLVIGFSLVSDFSGPALLYLLLSFLLLMVRSLLLHRSSVKDGRWNQGAITVLVAGALCCAGWLVIVRSLPILVPAGILAAAVLILNARDVKRGWNKQPLRQLAGVVVLTSNVVLIPYIAQGKIVADTIAIWMVVLMMFTVSITTMAFKQRVKDQNLKVLGWRERLVGSHVSFAIIALALIVLLTIPVLPIVSFHVCVGFLVVSILQRCVISPIFLVRWKDPIELALLSLWGIGFATGFLVH